MHVLVLTIEWSYYVHGTNTVIINTIIEFVPNCLLLKSRQSFRITLYFEQSAIEWPLCRRYVRLHICTYCHMQYHTIKHSCSTHSLCQLITLHKVGPIARSSIIYIKHSCLTTYNTLKGQTSMPPAGVEPAISADPRLRPRGYWDRICVKESVPVAARS